MSMRPIVLTILDGWGYSKESVGNAIATAHTPTLDTIQYNYPSLLLQASGPAVGIGWGEPGNSEVGHLSLGSGRIIFQYLNRISQAIDKNELAEIPALKGLFAHIQKNNSTLHLVGLLTSGSVHAYLGHLFALLAIAKNAGLAKINLHLFLDGRDSGLKEGVSLLRQVQEKLSALSPPAGGGVIASIIGRDYAMDRDNNWQKTETAYRLLVEGKGQVVNDISAAVQSFYDQGINDPDIPALNLSNRGSIADGDGVIFFNFREDSMRQLIKAFVDPEFNYFQTAPRQNVYLAGMTNYISSPSLHVLFDPPDVPNSLPEVISNSGKKQYHIAETEKYGHVTYFFNGFRTGPFDGETDMFVESLKNPLEQPQMKSSEIVQKVAEELHRSFYDFFVINLANGDMLSHLGNFKAVVKGVEAVDNVLESLMKAVMTQNGILIITADHGNAESLTYKGTGEKETRHNDNPVPFYLVASEYQKTRTETEIQARLSSAEGLLIDVAPTILELMGYPKPAEMTGNSLLPLL